MDRKELAVKLHHEKFNCAQAVSCAFCNVMGYDPATVFKLAEAFGRGMGGERTCGAVSAMAMVIGMKESDGNLDDPKTKQHCYRLMNLATEKFLKKHGSVTCSELKRTDGDPVQQICDGYIRDAAVILDEMLLGIKDEESEA